MTDIALVFDSAAWSADIAIASGDLVTDDGLRTAVTISLFTDARARDDDALPDSGADRRGWWGDCANDDANDRTGSRLWLLARAKVVPTTAVRARDYCREALDWLVADGVVAAIDIDCVLLPVAASRRSGGLSITITLTRPGGARLAINYLWDAESGRIEREGTA